MKPFAVLVAALFMVAAVGPSFVHAQVAPAPSKDTANSSAKVAPQADQGTGANPSKTKAKKETASSVAPAPSHDTANSSAKVAPQADQGTGTGMGQKKSSTP